MNFKNPLTGTTMLALIVAGCVAASYQEKKAAVQDKKAVPQVLNDKTFDYWRQFIYPTAAEASWERIGWQTSLWAGLTLAQEKKMPLMAWFMTGHPCGMT